MYLSVCLVAGTVVQWRILVDRRADPKNEDGGDPRYLCKHVNLVRVTHVPGEQEYLFQVLQD